VTARPLSQSWADAGVDGAGSGARHLLAVGIHLGLLFLIYAQAAGFDYVYYDDDRYILKNPQVLSGLGWDSARWAFTSLYMSNWHPLTWLSHMLDTSLFGTDPGPAHLHNVLLHGVNSLLVYALLLRYRALWWQAALLSLVFLAHPLHIESVAWIAERKDLLCALFYLLGLLSYDAYRREGGAGRYLAVCALCALALLSKPMAVTFPVVLVLLDMSLYRAPASAGPPRRHPAALYDVLRDKLPMLFMALVSGVVTIVAQDRSHAIKELELLGLAERVQTALHAYATYLEQWLRPVGLAAFYPHPGAYPAATVAACTLVVLGLLAVAVFAARRHRRAGAGLGFYFITLLPVIGLVQVGSQAHADRYMYLPSVGLLLALVDIMPRSGHRYFSLSAITGCLFLAYLSVLSYWQAGYWRDEHTLFTRSAEVTGHNFITHIHLAAAYERLGMPGMVIPHAEAAIALRPGRRDGHLSLAGAALAERRYADAERHYVQALSMGSEIPGALNNLGIAIAQQGRPQEALPLFARALEIDPGRTDARRNLRRYREQVTP